jgi:DNA-binding response OmpR family regulator
MIATAMSSPATERILYIEHHEDSRHMLAALLEYDGYEVVTANTLARGLRLAMLGRFDLYVLDGRFKDGTGVDLCRQLRAFHPDTPIIFYSSLAYAEDIEAGMAAGAQHYLIKPEGIYMIEQTIAGLLVKTTGARAYAQ